MKQKTTLTLLLLLFTVFSFAQYRNGNLNFLSESGEKFYVELNGQKINDYPQSNLRIENLNEPDYDVRIVFANRNLPQIIKNKVAIVDAEGVFRDATYKIKKEKGRRTKMKLTFVAMVPVTGYYNGPRNVFVIQYHQSEPTPGYPEPPLEPGCRNHLPMSNADFNSALATVKNQNFDETRLKIAKQIVSANCMSTDQIVKIAGTFGFDENKLDFAKYADDFCTDPGTYFKVNNVFGFSSSAEELSDYVQSKG
ncbi:MAG TPA: DUF4476 domain-containing protein [Flavobacterium sp.]|nr:DUF4476 domain-containing protein [Flavobacterium sp.]